MCLLKGVILFLKRHINEQFVVLLYFHLYIAYLFVLVISFLPLEYLKKICYYVFTEADVNFVPTFFIKGRIDSDGSEVYPPILSPVGNGVARGVHPPARLAGNKIAFAFGFYKQVLNFYCAL